MRPPYCLAFELSGRQAFNVGGNLISGPKRSMQRRLETVATEHGDGLYLRVERASDYMKENFPDIYERWKASLKEQEATKED